MVTTIAELSDEKKKTVEFVIIEVEVQQNALKVDNTKESTLLFNSHLSHTMHKYTSFPTGT